MQIWLQILLLLQSISVCFPAQTCTLNGPKEWPKDLSPEARARRVAHVAHGAHGAGNGANGAKTCQKKLQKIETKLFESSESLF